jgi:FemAB-related protein (PEP-CTERM system-associated)
MSVLLRISDPKPSQTSVDCSIQHPPLETAPLCVREFTERDHAAWDEFVNRHPHGTPFHLMAWRRSIEETFGFQPHYRLAIEGELIRGVLPMFLVKNFVLGSALISIPFATYGGILADTPTVRDALGADARSLGERLGVGYIELRNAYSEQCAGFERISRYATFVQALPPDEGALLQALPANMRSKVRRALKRGFSTRRQTTDFRAFAELHAANYRRLGTPSFPLRHYAALLKNFGESVDIREVLLDDRVVAASMNFFFHDQVHSFYVASDDRYHEALPNNYLYFDNMRWAGQNGYRYFDFGRSKKETGPFEFKRRWGIVPRELPYEILLIRRKDLPNFSPVNPRFQMAIRIWKKMPLSLTRILGPRLIRLFP